MRKFLLILLNVLCITAMNAQQRYYAGYRVYTGDTTKITYESKRYYDEKKCLDTAHWSMSISTNFSKNVRNWKFKYNSKNQLIEKLARDSNFTLSSGVYSFKSWIDKRSIYIYTPENVRADTIKNEIYDAANNVWKLTSTEYIRKLGVGNDTFRIGNAMEVYDANANLIMQSGLIGTTDSIVTTYRDKRIVKIENYSKSKMNSLEENIYEADNLKMNRRISYGTLGGKPISDTLTRSYTYKGSLKDTEEYDEKRYSTSGSGSNITRSLSTYNMYFRKYHYNTTDKTSGYEETVCNYMLPNKPCIKNEDYAIIYSKDSLLIIEKITPYTLGVPASTIYYEESFRLCTPLTSDLKENVLSKIDFTIAPNPTIGLFTLNVNTEKVELNNTYIRIFNIQGQEVYNQKVNANVNSIYISHLSKGFYLVKVADKTHFTVKKLILN